MGVAMALHFGSYEFIRNGCLALFTSKEFGFAGSATAYPVATGLVSPFSVMLLYAYGRQLEAVGPRGALFRSTMASILWIIVASTSLLFCRQNDSLLHLRQLLVGVTFLFQNSYQYLLYTQQWSFVGSVLTPEEGAKWFATLAGCSSMFCTLTGAVLPFLLPYTGLLGLLSLTAVFLLGTLVASDAAYAVAQKHGFDPSEQQLGKTKGKDDSSRLSKAIQLFRRVPTLGALMCEVLSFQSLNTILSVALVAALSEQIPDDLARSAFTGRLFSAINGVSAILQFAVLPVVMKKLEPAFLWRTMPLLPLLICGLQTLNGGTDGVTSSLALLAVAFAAAKVLDYSVRSVVYAMVYQPLDYESRYIGKEIIGVFGSRFGKSGMSWILSGLTLLGGGALARDPMFLSQISLFASLLWGCSTWWLSRFLPRQDDAQAVVEERQARQRQEQLTKKGKAKSGHENGSSKIN